MQLTSYLENRELTIALTGEIDHHYAKMYIESITSKIEAYTPKICVLDFQEVTFMDSSGIGLVLARSRFCTDCGAPLVEGAMFCAQCGKRQETAPVCAGCGRQLDAGQRFCPFCGTKVS